MDLTAGIIVVSILFLIILALGLLPYFYRIFFINSISSLLTIPGAENDVMKDIKKLLNWRRKDLSMVMKGLGALILVILGEIIKNMISPDYDPDISDGASLLYIAAGLLVLIELLLAQKLNRITKEYLTILTIRNQVNRP